jgi:hypothetical protein
VRRWKAASGLLTVVLMSACATVPQTNVKEVTRDIKSVTFLQNGKHAKNVTIGAVDGKTFWAGQSVVGQPANSASKADRAAAAQVTAVSAIGGLVASAAVEANKAEYLGVVTHAKERRELGLEAARAVMPAMAQMWGLRFDASRLVVLSEIMDLADAGQRLAADPGGDLVLAFTLQSVNFTEKVSVSGALLGSWKLGLGSRSVTSEMSGLMSAYRRQADGSLKHVWSWGCKTNLLEGPAVDWDALAADPTLMAPILDGTYPLLAKWCETTAKQQLASAN